MRSTRSSPSLSPRSARAGCSDIAKTQRIGDSSRHARVTCITIGERRAVVLAQDRRLTCRLRWLHESLVALLMRGKRTIAQFIAAGLAFIVVAPATTCAAISAVQAARRSVR